MPGFMFHVNLPNSEIKSDTDDKILRVCLLLCEVELLTRFYGLPLKSNLLILKVKAEIDIMI